MSASTLELLGCSIEEFKSHLESQFKDGMSWDNRGYYGWHIDHIIPCASFDLSNPAHQRACFNWRNLQPMWRLENQTKSNETPVGISIGEFVAEFEDGRVA